MPVISMNLGNSMVTVGLSDAQILLEPEALWAEFLRPAVALLLDTAYPGRTLARIQALNELLDAE